MRSPWRDALDGQRTAIRSIESDTGFRSFRTYFSASPSLQRTVPPARFDRAIENLSVDFCVQLADAVRAAEPYYLTADIVNEICRRTQAIVDRGYTLRLSDLPSRDGFLWFPVPIQVTSSPDGTAPPLWVRAIYWGRATTVSTAQQIGLLQGRMQISEPLPGLGVVLLLDSTKCGFTDGHEPVASLTPFMTNPWIEGDSLKEHIRLTSQTWTDDNDLTHQIWANLVLITMFDLMRQKVLLYGGSGLEREARRQAQRDGLKPIVQVVTWRKAAYRYPEGHIPASIDWSCQWRVKEHVRRYKSGKVVVIKPYIKGPDGKPFKDPNTIVNLVRR